MALAINVDCLPDQFHRQRHNIRRVPLGMGLLLPMLWRLDIVKRITNRALEIRQLFRDMEPSSTADTLFSHKLVAIAAVLARRRLCRGVLGHVRRRNGRHNGPYRRHCRHIVGKVLRISTGPPSPLLLLLLRCRGGLLLLTGEEPRHIYQQTRALNTLAKY